MSLKTYNASATVDVAKTYSASATVEVQNPQGILTLPSRLYNTLLDFGVSTLMTPDPWISAQLDTRKRVYLVPMIYANPLEYEDLSGSLFGYNSRAEDQREADQWDTYFASMNDDELARLERALLAEINVDELSPLDFSNK